ncbi:MAG: ankyrin repeat domain-containing protein [Bacteroidota bacterium]
MATDWLIPDSLFGLLAFGLTYLLHSSIWIGLVAILLRIPFFQTAGLQNFLWKLALVGGVLTSLYATILGHRVLQLPTSHPPMVQEIEELGMPMMNPVLPESEAGEAHIPILEQPSSEVEPTTAHPIPPIPATPSISSVEKTETGFSQDQILHGVLWGCLLFWLMGSLFLLGKHIYQHLRFFKRIRNRDLVDQPKVFVIFQQIQKKARLNLGFQLTSSPLLSSPIVIQGKEICLPAQALQTLEANQLEGLIAHELAHVVRKDYHWSWFLLILDSLLFFQPLHKWAKNGIHRSTELLCDNWAAHTTGDSFALANCLLAVAKWMKPQAAPYSLIAGMALRKSELSTRISQLINTTNMQTQHFSRLKAYLTLGIALPLVMWALPGFSFMNPDEDEAVFSHIDPPSIEQKEPALQPLLAEEETLDMPIPADVQILEERDKTADSDDPLLLEEEDETKDSGTFERFMEAVRTGDLDQAKSALRDESFIHQTDPTGRTPLIEAADHGHFLIAFWLIIYGADVNAVDNQGYSALIEAADHGHSQIASLLIEKGADINLASPSGYTPLMEAAFDGEYDMCSVFLQEGALVNAQTSRGVTALMDAARKGHEEIVILLLEAGADVNMLDERGESALRKAKMNGHQSIANLLLENGARKDLMSAYTDRRINIDPANAPVIRIEKKFLSNQNHPYYEIMRQIYKRSPEQQHRYFNLLYQQNTNCSRQSGKKGLLKNQGGKNSWIFTLDYGSYVIYDTLQNCVHPGPGDQLYDAWKKEKEGLGITENYSMPIGSLPRGVGNLIQSPINDKLRVQLTLDQKRAVKIYVETIEGHLYHTITDSQLKGTFTLSWDVSDVPKDTYWLHITVDGQTLSQRIGKNCSIRW